MTKTQRLMELVQLLRCHRYPVTAQHLAEQLSISVRTVYRDIICLQQQGVESRAAPTGVFAEIRRSFTALDVFPS
ncbi:HTH domain-containing protein (plasmid) [Pseudomonas silvicola]|nr:HTH domain-containing protein [Pseudomonas silvicola]